MTGTLSELWLQGGSRRGLQQEPLDRDQGWGGSPYTRRWVEVWSYRLEGVLRPGWISSGPRGGPGVVGQARAKGKKQVTGQAKKKSTSNPRRS